MSNGPSLAEIEAGNPKCRLETSVAVQEKSSGQLNPLFVEWLMNFPKGWTELENGTKNSEEQEIPGIANGQEYQE
jgi:hypothetical protein